jgi:CBS domain-containing membrane protein
MPLPSQSKPAAPTVQTPDSALPLPAPVRLLRWLHHFWPAPLGIDGRERIRFITGVVLGVLLTAVLSRAWAGSSAHGPWMLGSLGASAILVFGMPSSPLAQPWPVLGGSSLSALVGAACAALVPDPAIAGALAVGCAVAIMVPLRCLHPPGGAMALYVVLTAGDDWHLACSPSCLTPWCF